MEPEIPETNFKSMAVVLWTALVMAIIVTIIDWKIKQDILRLTDAFYRIYPSTMEAQHAAAVPPRENPTYSSGHPNHNSVLRFPVVGNDSGVEEKAAPVSLTKSAEDHSGDWARYAPEVETGLPDA